MPEASSVTIGISPHIFWDVNATRLDADRYAAFVIIRVFERGTEQDVMAAMRYYGSATIIATLTMAPQLLPRACALGKKFFHLSTDQFACFRQQ